MTEPTTTPAPTLSERLAAEADSLTAWLKNAGPPQIGDDEDRPEDITLEPSEVERLRNLLVEASEGTSPAGIRQRFRTSLREALINIREAEPVVVDETTPEMAAEGRVSFKVALPPEQAVRFLQDELTQARTQVAAYSRHYHALGQHLLAAHKPGEVDDEAVAILDGYHVGARTVAGGQGETTMDAALRLLKLAHQRGVFLSANAVSVLIRDRDDSEHRARALHKLLAEIYAYDLAAGEDHWAFRLKALRLAKRANIYYGVGEDGQLVPTSPERAKAFAAEYDAEDADQPVTVSKVDDNTALRNLLHAMGRSGQPFDLLSDAAQQMGLRSHINSATGEFVVESPRDYADPAKASAGPFDLAPEPPPGYTVIISSTAGQDFPYLPDQLGAFLTTLHLTAQAHIHCLHLTRKAVVLTLHDKPSPDAIAAFEAAAAEYSRAAGGPTSDKSRVTVTTATEDDMKRMAFFQAAQRAEADREEKARPATLPQLLESLFTVDELRRFVAEVWGQDHAITKAIPEDDAIAFEHTAGMFASGGYLPEVWLSLLEHRPRRGADIGHVMSRTPNAMPARTYGRSTEPRPTLREAIQHAINTCSAENGSNTPDFILAEALMSFLAAFNHGVNERDGWYGVAFRPGAQEVTDDGKVLVPAKFTAAQAKNPAEFSAAPIADRDGVWNVWVNGRWLCQTSATSEAEAIKGGQRFARATGSAGLEKPLQTAMEELAKAEIPADLAARLRARGLVVPGEETPGDDEARAAIFAADLARGRGSLTVAEIRERDERPLTAAEMVASKPQPDPAG